MAKGEHPNSKANLKPLSTNEARERGAKGGTVSGKVRRERRLFRDLDKTEITEEDRKEMLLALVKKAKNGDTFAFMEYCKITGQYETALDQKEQKAKIDKLKAESESLRAKTEQITGNDRADSDGVTIILGLDDRDEDEKPFLPTLREVTAEKERLENEYGKTWKDHIEPKWEKYLK